MQLYTNADLYSDIQFTAGRPPLLEKLERNSQPSRGPLWQSGNESPVYEKEEEEEESCGVLLIFTARGREPVAATGMGRKRGWKEGKKTSRRRRRKRKVPTFPDFLRGKEVDGAESVNVPSPPFLLSIQIYTGNRKYSCWLPLLPLLLHGATVSSVRPFPFCMGKNCYRRTKSFAIVPPLAPFSPPPRGSRARRFHFSSSPPPFPFTHKKREEDTFPSLTNEGSSFPSASDPFIPARNHSLPPPL